MNPSAMRTLAVSLSILMALFAAFACGDDDTSAPAATASPVTPGTTVPAGGPTGTAVPATPADGPGGPTLGWADDFTDDGRLNVATTVAPISSIVRNIGGTRIELYGIVPAGTNSHTFEPAPSDAEILADADVVFINGLHLEEPTRELAEANLKERAEIFLLGDNTITEEEYVYDFSFPEEEGNPNPHLWTDVTKAQEYAAHVRDVLSRRDPDNATYYAANFEAYNAKLQQLHEGILAAVETIPPENRKLVTYHDSFPFFSQTYGMEIIGAIQPSDFAEPSARDVAEIIEQIREEDVPAIFGSEVFPSPVLEQIANETGAVFVDRVRDDAPPGEPNSPEHTYIGMMLANMEAIVPALGGNTAALQGISPADTFSP